MSDTEEATSEPQQAAFTTDDDRYFPQPPAQGPWGATVGGQTVGGLLARAIERDARSDDLHPARLTVDLMRPVLMQPLSVHTQIRRDGRRIRVIDAEIHQNEMTVARASGLYIRRPGHHPAGAVWSGHPDMPPPPTDAEAAGRFFGATPNTLRRSLPLTVSTHGSKRTHASSPGCGN